MAQPDAGARKENKCKSSSFSRKVTLIKLDDECTSFSEMRNLSDKSVIELSTRMTQDSIKDKILETFPYLEEKRSSFRCAALKKVDNDRKVYDFGGSRIWDGKTIRAKINANSNLYILEQQSREDRSSSDDDSPVLTRGILESDQESLENVEDTSIIPPSGSVEGGYPFHINFRKELPEDVSSGKVEFFGVDNVVAQRVMNTPALTGIVPSRLLPGTVKVTAWTNASDFLGETYFTYHAKMPPKEVKQLLYNPNQLSSFFGSLAEQFGFSEENECSVGDSYSSISVQDPASFVQMQKQQSLKILELLLYTAAEDDAQPFVEMLFSTSAGPIVFNYYKSRRPLPEDVAQANGNDELAQYLRDINTRLSKEKPADTESSAVNWLELAKAVQQQAAIPSDLAQDQSRGLLRNPTENDGEDNSSNNFADSSSSASSDSEDKAIPSDLAQDQSRGLLRNPTKSDGKGNSSNNFTDSSFSASSDSGYKEAELQRKTSELKVSCNYETDGVLKGPPSVEILPGKPFHATQRRGGEIQKIQQAFSQLRQDATASSLVSAVYVKGPPGCGKTQLVRQFGKEYMKVSAGCGGQSPRRIVATLDARTPESLLESYKELHEKLEMSKESEERGSLNERLKTYSNVIKNHLCKSSTVWLLIIDNLTVNDPLREFWPTPEENSPWGEGLVLVTTQDSELVPRSHAYAKVVGLDEGMEQSDAKKLLSTISELEADEDAIKVAQLLGFYPLSLACAAVYVKQMREDRPASEFSWKNYLANLKKCFAYLDHSDFTRHNPCYPQSMLPAAEFAARRMAENNEVLRAAFVFLSYCALQPVPLDTVAEYVFYETAVSGDQTIRVPDDVKVKIAQCSLLIYPETGERGIEVVTLHQVMRLAFAQIRRKPDEQTKEMEETAEVEKRQLNGVLEVLNKAYKIRKGDVSKEAIATRIILCPHLREFVEKAENSQFVEVNLLVQALVYLADGLVHVAGATDNNRVGLLERAYKINKQLSTTDISACELLCELGYTYREAGQLDRVIPLLEEANHLCTAHTEPEWMKMRSSLLNILGFTYRESFQLDLAKEYMKMCAEVTRKAYGEKHVQVVERLCNLGIILHDRWENDEAIEVLEEAQKIIEACDTSRTELFIRAQVLNYTAKVHLRWYLGLRYTHPCAWSTKKHLEESNALHEEAVKIYKELHGDQHKFTLGTMMTYGTAKLHLGQVEQAYEMCHNAVQVYRSSGHISWPRAGTWLADVFLVRKEYARAKSFLEELVKVHEDLHLVVSPGAYHPKALLAEACVHLGNVQYGKDMLTQCLREWEEKGMHPDHYWVARARAFLRLHEEQNTDDAVQEL